MRVAVFEPYPRNCGVTKWAFEQAPGFRKLGHHCDVLSFTKSGRPFATIARDGGIRKGWRWWAQEPDVVARWDNAPDVLNSYDLIVLPEPKNNPLDEEAKKAGTDMWPDYVWALSETRTPWVTIFHDTFAYLQRNAPYMPELLRTKSFSGLAIQLRQGAFDVAAWAAVGPVTKLLNWPWIPYNLKNDVNAPIQHNQLGALTIGSGGRILSTKGYHALASIAHQLDPATDVQIFGSESGGMGACPSFVLYELLVKYHGWRGTRGDPNFVSDQRSAQSIEMGNFGATNMVHPWQLTHDGDGYQMRYTGPYLNGVERSAQCAIITQLSPHNQCTSFDTTTLEAIDAGCKLVLPQHYQRDMLDTPWDVASIPSYSSGVSMSAKYGIRWNDPDERSGLLETLSGAIDHYRHNGYDPAPNRKTLALYHDPARLAQAIIDNL